MTCGQNHPWPIERVEKLKQLAAQKLSAAKIAEQLGNGVTRNGVIGQCKRKGIPLFGKKGSTPIGEPQPIAIAEPATKNFGWRRQKLKPMTLAPPPPKYRPPKGKSWMSLFDAGEGNCKFVHGEARFGMICGEKTVIGYSYCQNHKLIVFAH